MTLNEIKPGQTATIARLHGDGAGGVGEAEKVLELTDDNGYGYGNSGQGWYGDSYGNSYGDSYGNSYNYNNSGYDDSYYGW